MGLLLLLGVVVGLSFGPALDGGFVWDDSLLIENNPFIKDFKHLTRNFTSNFWDIPTLSGQDKSHADRSANLYYRPLVTLSYMVDHALYGLEPGGFHLTNLLLHGLALVLVLLLCRRLFVGAPWVWLVVALIVAVHPSRAEAVCWVAGRTDLMMTVGVLTALLLFRRACLDGSRRALVGGWLATVAAMLCKEGAIAVCVVVPAMDALVFNRTKVNKLKINAFFVHGPLILLGGLYLALRLVYQRMVLGDGPNAGLSVVERLDLVLSTAAYNAALVVWPYAPSGQVGLFHNPREHSALLLAGGATAVVIWAVALWLSWRRRPLVALGLVLFGAALAPSSNLVPLSIMTLTAERFLYLPLLGLALAVGALVERQMVRGKGGVATALVLAALIGSWALTTRARAADYRSSETFWRSELATSPQSPISQEEYGQSLMRSGHYRQAEPWLHRAMRTNARLDRKELPDAVEVIKVLEAHFMHTTGDGTREQLTEIVDFTEVLLAASESSDTPKNTVPESSGTSKNPRRRVRLWLHGQPLVLDLTSRATLKKIVDKRATLLALAGNAHSHLGNDRRSLAYIRLAVQIDPGHLVFQMNLIQALLRAGQLRHTGPVFRRLTAAAPHNPLLARLGKSLASSKEILLKIKALDSMPGDKRPATARHWLLADLYRSTGAALRLEAELVAVTEQNPRDRRAWATLVTVQARRGRRADARETLNRAKKLFGSEPGLLRLESQLARDR